MKIIIKVTKEIYRQAMWCGTITNYNDWASKNCAIALAIREFDEHALVDREEIHWTNGKSDLPSIATSMIRKFDDLAVDAYKRLYLPEFSFEVEFPSVMIDLIGIGQVYKILSESKTLELVAP